MGSKVEGDKEDEVAQTCTFVLLCVRTMCPIIHFSLDMYMGHKYCLSQSVCRYCYVVTNISCKWSKFVLLVATHEHRPSE